MNLQYRREIDGLRAVAVIPVLLYHAGFPLFSGGFVGVDIFFVISGYLISNIIITELDTKRFSIVRFYERRARRILPALSLVMIVTTPAAYFVMLPEEFKDYGQSLLATSVFASNILFWIESGYFAGAVDYKPLIHTWSLAVEEQYYVLFPILMIAIWQFGARFKLLLLIILMAASLASAEWASGRGANWASASFYLLPFRAWELLLGVIATIYLKSAPISTRMRSETMSILGFGAIVASVFLFDHATVHPGVLTILPVLGTVLIVVFCSNGTLIGRILGAKPIVGVGLISYSLYLWHQPLFAIARIWSLHEPPEWVFMLLICISLLLAYLSWRYVEAPFRSRDIFSRTQIFSMAGASISFGVVLGALLHATTGFQSHFRKNLPQEDQGIYTAYSEAFQWK